MRWSSVSIGDRRFPQRFLWLPKTLDGETRWLEEARWEEQRDYSPKGRGPYWRALGWLRKL